MIEVTILVVYTLGGPQQVVNFILKNDQTFESCDEALHIGLKRSCSSRCNTVCLKYSVIVLLDNEASLFPTNPDNYAKHLRN